MLAYYLRLAVISIRKNPVMSALMVAAIALGIGACMTVITVNYIMAKDPIPLKSAELFVVQLDSWDPNSPANEDGRPPNQLTYIDAMAIMQADRAFRQTANAGASLVIESSNRDVKPFQVRARAAFADFFPMFDVPFLYGGGWDESADTTYEQVAVLSRETNDRVFGGENSVGRNLRMSGHDFTVVGVLDDWKPVPKFYDVLSGPFDAPEAVFIPFNLIQELGLSRVGNTNCWKPIEGEGIEAFLTSECIWIQFWVELRSAAERREYQAFLDAYVAEQKALGRFQRPLDNRLTDVREWLEVQEVVAQEAAIMVPVSLMFLGVCLLNTIGLLLAKFLGKAPEIGLRRALGASKRSLFTQYLIESACIGIAGGVLGVILTWVGLRGVAALFGDVVENLVQLDWIMILTAVALAIVSSIAAGLYPTWRACNVQPAAQLKTH